MAKDTFAARTFKARHFKSGHWTGVKVSAEIPEPPPLAAETPRVGAGGGGAGAAMRLYGPPTRVHRPPLATRELAEKRRRKLLEELYVFHDFDIVEAELALENYLKSRG